MGAPRRKVSWNRLCQLNFALGIHFLSQSAEIGPSTTHGELPAKHQLLTPVALRVVLTMHSLTRRCQKDIQQVQRDQRSSQLLRRPPGKPAQQPKLAGLCLRNMVVATLTASVQKGTHSMRNAF